MLACTETGGKVLRLPLRPSRSSRLWPKGRYPLAGRYAVTLYGITLKIESVIFDFQDLLPPLSLLACCASHPYGCIWVFPCLSSRLFPLLPYVVLFFLFFGLVFGSFIGH